VGDESALGLAETTLADLRAPDETVSELDECFHVEKL
jgi:hypothetical protein